MGWEAIKKTGQWGGAVIFYGNVVVWVRELFTRSDRDQALGKALHGACSCLKNILLRQPFQRNIWGDRMFASK